MDRRRSPFIDLNQQHPLSVLHFAELPALSCPVWAGSEPWPSDCRVLSQSDLLHSAAWLVAAQCHTLSVSCISCCCYWTPPIPGFLRRLTENFSNWIYNNLLWEWLFVSPTKDEISKDRKFISKSFFHFDLFMDSIQWFGAACWPGARCDNNTLGLYWLIQTVEEFEESLLYRNDIVAAKLCTLLSNELAWRFESWTWKILFFVNPVGMFQCTDLCDIFSEKLKACSLHRLPSLFEAPPPIQTPN